MDPQADLSPLQHLECVREVTASNGHWRLGLADSCTPPDAIQSITSTVPPARIELQRPTLEDVFVELVRDAALKEGQDAEALRASVRSGPALTEAGR
jgi:ABC-type uncharacterized transport system ATPase subunit